jgi:hypothetical protein
MLNRPALHVCAPAIRVVENAHAAVRGIGTQRNWAERPRHLTGSGRQFTSESTFIAHPKCFIWKEFLRSDPLQKRLVSA